MEEEQPKASNILKSTDPVEKVTVEESGTEAPAEMDPQLECKAQEGQSPSWLANAWGSSGSWIQTAKDKTLSTIESMKKDLNEFSDTLQHEATVLASSTANTVKHQAQLIQQFVVTPDGQDLETVAAPASETHVEQEKKQQDGEAKPNESDDASSSLINEQPNPEGSFFSSKWVKTLVETVQKLGIEDTTKEEDKYTEEIKVGMPRKTTLDQVQLHQIQNDERTFLQAPVLNTELYNEWLQDFNIGEYNGEINMLLGYNPKLRQIYSKLVPSKVDNHMFWNRYFFKVYILELDKEIAEKSTEENKEGGESSGNGGAMEKEETWSMCSSANNDLQTTTNWNTSIATSAKTQDA